MINAKHITKKYKSTVLKDISFTAEKGECIGILGANGCGKTTLLTIMAGVRRSDGGSLTYNGEAALGKKSVCRKYTGYVPQNNPLIEELSCRDNLKLWCDIPIKEFLNRTEIKRLGIEEYIDKRVSKLSGGMKRRLAIAIALVSRPPVLILDEPGTALDIKGRAEIADYLKVYTASGGTVVMTTHIESEIALCTKLFIMKDGVLNPVKNGLTIDEITALI
jgi:ABC-2 type transport system ATP-binding protein